jgi:ferrous iron transport protein B
VIDTPGILALDVASEDGLVSRNILLDEHPEVIILCLDSNNIKRSLQLLAQIMELEIALVVCLNFLDESRQKGILIDRKSLEEMLGVPVIETVASEGRGIRELTRALARATVPRQARVTYKPFIEQGLDEIESCFSAERVPSDAVLALLLIEDHEIEQHVRAAYGEEVASGVKRMAKRVQAQTQKEISRIMLEAREAWAEEAARAVARVRTGTSGRVGEAVAATARHPVFGWLLLGVIIYLTYLLVGTVAASLVVPLIDRHLFVPLNEAIAAIVPWQLARDFLIGHYGILTTGLENALGTVLPILTMFFLILNLLEDTGYIPNLTVLCNRLFQKVGLSGKAILPVVLGFGCKTMATMATRILDSRRERYIAIFLIAFAMPCSAQFGINLAILALFPFRAFCLVFGILIALEIVAGMLLNLIMKDDQGRTDFIMEIPPIRAPSIRGVATKTYYRVKWFLAEAIPLFMIGAAIFFLMEQLHILGFIKGFLFPVIVSFLSLPIETVDVLLLCIARREAGAVILMDLVKAGKFDYIQTIVGVVVITCFMPCSTNIMAMVKELGLRRAILMILVIIVVSVIIGGAINYGLRAL